MRRIHLVLAFPALAAVGIASSARAATYYVSPAGAWTTGCATRETSCSLATGAALAMAGDTVVLMPPLTLGRAETELLVGALIEGIEDVVR